jgi:hypothetical protein
LLFGTSPTAPPDARDPDVIVPIAQLTDDQIRAADVISAVDLTDPDYEVLVYRAGHPPGWAPVATSPTARVLMVGLDTDRRDAQVDDLRQKVAAVKSGSP